MTTTRTRPRKTVEDYMNLPEGMFAEFIGGEIYRSPSPKDAHQRIVGNLYFALRSFVDARGLGAVRTAPDDVHLPSGDVVQPDVLYIAKANLGIIRDWIRGAPDLVVEVLSPENAVRDRVVKLDLYANNGVKEYWIVDDAAKSVEIFVLSGNRYLSDGYFQKTDAVNSKLLRDLSLPVRDVLA